MVVVVIPIFIATLFSLLLGFKHAPDTRTRALVVASGALVLLMCFPLTIHIINSFTGNRLVQHAPVLIQIAEGLTIADGDIYVGAIGLIFTVATMALFIFHVMLAMSGGGNPRKS